MPEIHPQNLENQGIQESLQALQQANDELRQFAHLASHQLREPLRAITNYAALLEQHTKGKLDQHASHLLGRIVEASSRMNTLTRDLLEYAEVTSGSPSFQPVNTAEVLNQARLDLASSLEHARAQIRRGDLGWVAGDPTALRTLFRNLLSNAVKFRRGSHPIIEVGSRLDQDVFIFWMTDDGIGIPVEHCQDVFLPFRRLHPSQDFPGTGMGLTVAKQIVERHRGQIGLTRNQHMGITVWFSLPAWTKDGQK